MPHMSPLRSQQIFIQPSTLPRSHTWSKCGPTVWNLHTKCCATQISPHCWKLSKKGSSTGAQSQQEVDVKISQPKSGNSKGTRYGICSTRPKPRAHLLPILAIAIVLPLQHIVGPGQLDIGPHPMHHIINDDMEESIANVFLLRCFCRQKSRCCVKLPHGEFSHFMSYNRYVCFLVLYHYKADGIMATPVAGLNNISILMRTKRHLKTWNLKGSNQNWTSWTIKQLNTSKKSHQNKLQTATSWAT